MLRWVAAQYTLARALGEPPTATVATRLADSYGLSRPTVGRWVSLARAARLLKTEAPRRPKRKRKGRSS
jgi:hypothetical protein